MNNNKLLERIKNLLAMAKDVSSPEEAMIAARRARQLMDKHQVEEFDLEQAIPSDFGDEVYESGMKTRLKPLSVLGVAIAKYNDCQATYSGANILFKGFKADTVIAVDMMKYIVKVMYSLSKEMKLTRAKGNGFRQGFASGVAEQVTYLLEERGKITLATGTSLVICKKQLVAQEFGTARYTTSSATCKDISAFETGRSIGKNINLAKQTKLARAV